MPSATAQNIFLSARYSLEAGRELCSRPPLRTNPNAGSSKPRVETSIEEKTMTQEPQDGSIPNQQEQVCEWDKENGVHVRKFVDSRTTTTEEPVRCAIYTRTNIAAQIDAVQPQRKATRAFIASQGGWACVGMYEDIGNSGGTMNRPAMRSLLEDLDADKVDCVVMHTLDRLTRSDGDHAKLIAEFRRCDVTLVIVHPVSFVVVGNKARDASTGGS
jgi:hypothetical protein